MPLEVQIALARTADYRAALAHLGSLRERLVLDLGGGLGIHAVLLARRGARVVVADLSIARLRKARALLEDLGLADRVQFVCCAAEELPFRDGLFDAQITKSVLIHTDLAKAAEELERTLAREGRAAFIEPLTGNPFVNLYRRLSAPGIWQEITRYFDDGALRELQGPFRSAGRAVATRRLFLFAFFATPFNFIFHRPRLYFLAERMLLGLDRLVFSLLPFTRRAAWFSITVVAPGKRR